MSTWPNPSGSSSCSASSRESGDEWRGDGSFGRVAGLSKRRHHDARGSPPKPKALLKCDRGFG